MEEEEEEEEEEDKTGGRITVQKLWEKKKYLHISLKELVHAPLSLRPRTYGRRMLLLLKCLSSPHIGRKISTIVLVLLDTCSLAEYPQNVPILFVCVLTCGLTIAFLFFYFFLQSFSFGGGGMEGKVHRMILLSLSSFSLFADFFFLPCAGRRGWRGGGRRMKMPLL